MTDFTPYGKTPRLFRDVIKVLLEDDHLSKTEAGLM